MRILCIAASVGLASLGAQADLIKVPFGATIFETPFSTAGFTVGSPITGAFFYDQNAPPDDTGLNFRDYAVPKIELRLASSDRVTSGRIRAIDDLRGEMDVFDLDIHTLKGPSVEGYTAGFGTLFMEDTDRAAYSSNHMPIDFPDPALFEKKSLSIHFALPNPGRFDPPVVIRATIGFIGPPTQVASVPESGSLAWMFLATVSCLAVVRKYCSCNGPGL